MYDSNNITRKKWYFNVSLEDKFHAKLHKNILKDQKFEFDALCSKYVPESIIFRLF